MSSRRIAAFLLAALLLAGCSRPTIGAVERLRLKPGEELPGPGIYFLETAGGAVEGWRSKDDGANARYQVTPDNRFVGIQTEGGRHLLIDRKRGWTFTTDGPLVTGGGGRLLLEEATGAELGTSGRYVVRDTNQKLITRLELPEAGSQSRAVISSDGRGALLATFTPNGKALLYLLDLKEGEGRLVTDFAAALEGPEPLDMTIRPVPGTEEVLVTMLTQTPGAGVGLGQSSLHTTILRVDWEGKILSEKRVQGEKIRLSPNGNHLIWQADVAGYPGATMVADREAEVLFRVKGFSPDFHWMAGSDSFILNNRGVWQQVTLGGELSPLPLCSGALDCRPGVTPAPDDPDLFLVGRSLLAGSGGQLRHDLKIASDAKLQALNFKPWEGTSTELRIVVGPEAATGWDGYFWEMELQVEQPPFDDRLVVKGTGDCLNLRDAPKLDAPVRACLPDGTALTVVAGNSRDGSLLWGELGQWVRVRTESGHEGWASIGSGYIGWLR